MSAGVYTDDLRVEFVDGQETPTPDSGFVACGDGTAFPMEATLDQIAELWYRVKDAWFTGGFFEWTFSAGSEISASLSVASAAPANRTLQVDEFTYQKRGYSVEGGNDYSGALYDAGDGVDYGDIADNERGMWDSNYRPLNAFSYEADDPNNTQGGTSEWWGEEEAGCRVSSFFGGRVAVVKTDPANGFFDPTNKFFLEFEHYWFDYNVVVNFGGWTNIYDGVDGDISAVTAHAVDYIIRLQSGDISCPIYMAYTLSAGGSDVIHEAKEWWPYAKNSPAVPVWNTATGAKL